MKVTVCASFSMTYAAQAAPTRSSHPAAPFRLGQLANGVQFLILHTEEPGPSQVLLSIRAGNDQESAEDYQIAHVIEHLQVAQTRKFPNLGGDIRSLGFGDRFNAYTTPSSTNFRLTFRSDAASLIRAADISAEWIVGAVIDPARVAQAVAIVERETDYRGRTGSEEIVRINRWLAEPHVPKRGLFFYPEGGQIDVQRAFELAHRFYTKWYHPSRATVVVITPMPLDEVEEIIERSIGGARKGTQEPSHFDQTINRVELHQQTKIRAESPKSHNASALKMVMKFRTNRCDVRQRLIREAIELGLIGRRELWSKLVGGHLPVVATIQDILPVSSETGTVSISVVHPESLLGSAQRIFDFRHSMAATGLSAEEFAAAKAKLLARYPKIGTARLASLSTVAAIYADLAGCSSAQRSRSLRLSDEIMALSLADVNRLARVAFSSRDITYIITGSGRLSSDTDLRLLERASRYYVRQGDERPEYVDLAALYRDDVQKPHLPPCKYNRDQAEVTSVGNGLRKVRFAEATAEGYFRPTKGGQGDIWLRIIFPLRETAQINPPDNAFFLQALPNFSRRSIDIFSAFHGIDFSLRTGEGYFSVEAKANSQNLSATAALLSAYASTIIDPRGDKVSGRAGFVALAGDIDEAVAINAIACITQQMRRYSASNSAAPPRLLTSGLKIITLDASTEAAQVSITISGRKSDWREADAEFLAFVLDGRIKHRLRDIEGASYGPAASVDRSIFSDAYSVEITFDSQPVDVDRLVDAVYDEISKLNSSQASDNELLDFSSTMLLREMRNDELPAFWIDHITRYTLVGAKFPGRWEAATSQGSLKRTWPGVLATKNANVHIAMPE